MALDAQHIRRLQQTIPEKTTERLLIEIWSAGVFWGFSGGFSNSDGALMWEYGMAATQEIENRLRQRPDLPDYQI